MWTALADLARDIAGDLPEEAFVSWEDPSKRNEALAARILEPFRRQGTVVASDTAGLSKMSARLPIAVVLKRIDAPKRRIHRVGTAIGGKAVGTWVADNTEMLFPRDVPVDTVVTAMCRVHDDAPVHDDGPVQVGFCIHVGTFYEIGGGLYGPDADRVELLAEDHTSGGETLVTPECQAVLAAQGFRFTERDEGVLGRVFLVQTDAEGPAPSGSPDYPLPYDTEMNALLEALDERDPSGVLARIDARYRSERTVLLAERHQHRPVRNRTETVDALVADVRFQQVIAPVLKDATDHWTVGGALALGAFVDSATALHTARRLRDVADEAGITLTIGLDRGETYLFPMGGGRTEFAGDPVNRASKVAEDLAEAGSLALTDRAAAGLSIPDARPAHWEISGIVIDALVL
jgi:hypothetical protein